MEPLDCYHEGGFHPIIIGDILNERYRIVRKLGSGSSATFWLVEDVPLKRYASLKVLSHDWAPTSYEIDVARYLMFLQDQPNPHPGADYVVKIFDVFVAHGPNGAHPCIVTELLGPNLLENTEWVDIREYWTRLSPEVSKKVVAQLSLGVGYLHNCGVIHGGK
ncbi:kinase-like domain-containing protein [Cyathus striatus]|nr:kinase-like domain-containing protein [Cyathus striatus]